MTRSAEQPQQDRSWILVFAAGAAAATVVQYSVWWYNHQRSLGRRDDLASRHGNHKSRPAAAASSDSPPTRGSTESRAERKNLLQRMEERVSRIGELPRSIQRTRWPWDRLKRSASQSEANAASEPNAADAAFPTNDRRESATGEADGTDQKSSLCIGSIFGMDVGGTLAKLCYFESVAPTTPMAPPSHASDEAKLDNDHDPTRIRRHQRIRTMAYPNELRGLFQTDDDDENGALLPHRSRMIRRQRSNSMNDSDDYCRAISSKSTWSPAPVCVARSYDDSEVSMSTRHTTDQNAESPRRASIWRKRLSDATTETPKTEDEYATSNGTPDDRDETSSNSTASMRRARSMFDLRSMSLDNTGSQWVNHAAALDRFYSFARRLDSYRAGVRDTNLSFYSNELGGEFHFIRFETRRMQNAMDLIMAHKLHLNIHEMGGTGGGAHKFASVWQEKLGITMKKQDELDSLVAGMQFVLSTVVGECYTFRLPRKANDGSTKAAHLRAGSDGSIPIDDDMSDRIEDRGKGDEWWWSRKVQRDSISYSSTYPYLVVTIGTGVSVLRVDGPRKYERVSGSTIGGGTYLGLIRLLTDVEDFEDVMRLAERGDPTKVDMMVGDIYGENSDALEKLGLPSHLVASSFGKLVAKEDPAAGLKQEDLARALLMMITNNIGQVAYLNAKLFNTPRIYFVGNFLRENKISQRRLSYAIHYWSKGEMEALFLEHEGYFGALGAFLLAQQISLT